MALRGSYEAALRKGVTTALAYNSILRSKECDSKKGNPGLTQFLKIEEKKYNKTYFSE